MVNVCHWLRPYWIFYVIWAVLNGFLFWNTYRLYKGQPQYYYLHQMLGSGLCISRGSGAVLNLSCGLVLLPTCKWISTIVRNWLSWTGRPSAHRFLATIFNRAELLHVTCAVTIILASVVHTGAHVANAINFSRYYNPKWTEINMAEFPGQDPLLLVLTTVPGITGMLMMFILIVFVITSGRWFRSRYFNSFYLTHNFLFGPFLILLIFHPISGILKEQINWRDHQPGKTSDIDSDNDETRPLFTSMPTHTWIWVSVPLTAYVVDWTIRRFIRRRPALISRTVEHGTGVLELVVDRCWISKSQPGQYVLLQCPAVSGFEWHPFSLSSCCDVTHSCWTVHLKTGGDW